MNPYDKVILPFIFMNLISLSAFFAYMAHDTFPIWIILIITLVAGFIIGTGYVRYLVEPMERRSNELELLSRQTLHELNLPVASIVANTQMLLKHEDNEKNIKRLQRINQAAATLETMYKELDYIIKKQIRAVELEVCDLKELILSRLEDYKELFTQINFVVDLESSSVKVDTIGFIKVLDNLIHNAVKYSQPQSQIKITLKAHRLRVQDEGIGMEEDFFLQAFEHYYQADQANSGQGLGLGLVKEYCDRYKIKIFVESAKEKGTSILLDFSHVLDKDEER